MAKTYRRFSTEFKLGVIESYLADHESAKAIANAAGINHSLLHFWLGKYGRGELSVEQHLEETLVEAESKIAALERNVGQLTMELDLQKKGLIAVPGTSSERLSILSGPLASASPEGAA